MGLTTVNFRPQLSTDFAFRFQLEQKLLNLFRRYSNKMNSIANVKVLELAEDNNSNKTLCLYELVLNGQNGDAHYPILDLAANNLSNIVNFFEGK